LTMEYAYRMISPARAAAVLFHNDRILTASLPASHHGMQRIFSYEMYFIKTKMLQFLGSGLAFLESSPHPFSLSQRQPFIFNTPLPNSSQWQVKHNAYFPVPPVWPLQRVPACFRRHVAGVEYEVAARFQRLAFRGFEHIPDPVLLRAVKTGTELIPYPVRAYYGEAASELAGKGSFAAVRRAAQDNQDRSVSSFPR
jgi:hypothetical protein